MIDNDNGLHVDEVARFSGSSSSSVDSNFTKVGEWLWGQCLAVAVREKYLYMGNGRLIQVYDVSRPDSHVLVREINTGGIVGDIHLRDTLAYILSGAYLIVASTSDPSNLAYLGSTVILLPTRVVANDSIAYVSWYEGLKTVDITDPRNPRVLTSRFTAERWPSALVVKDDIAFLGSYQQKDIEMFNIGNPADPVWLGTVNGDNFSQSASSMCRKDTLLFSVEQNWLSVYSIADVHKPVRLALQKLTPLRDPDRLIAMAAYGDTLFFAASGGDVCLIDISNPSQPREGKWLLSPDRLNGRSNYAIAFREGYLYASEVTRVKISRLVSPDSLMHHALLPAGGDGAVDAVLEGNYAFVASGRAGLTVLDVTQPESPSYLATLTLHGSARSIVLRAPYVYIVAGEDGIYAVNIENPAKPVISDYVPIKGTLLEVALGAQLACVSVLDSGFVLFDIASEPGRLRPVGKYPGKFIGAVAKDSLLFISASALQGAIIVNIADPYHPVEISRIPSQALGMCLSDDSLLYLNDAQYLRVYNIAQPSKPVLVESIPTPGTNGYSDMRIDRGFLYVSFNGRVRAFDISNPLKPSMRGLYEPFYGAQFYARDGYVYYCAQRFGLEILRNERVLDVAPIFEQMPVKVSLEQNYPNPFNPTTHLRFTICDLRFVSLKVYNVLGEEVATLVNEVREPGEYSVPWNATGMPSGIYLYRLMAGGYSEVKKMIYLR